MDLYAQNIDNNDKNTWMKIYETIDEPYFGEVELFSKDFFITVKRIQACHRISHLKPRRIF